MQNPITKPASTPSLARFWGVRGSIPTPGKDTVRYGGNTSCLELRIQDELIVIDAGSGIRPLGGALLKEFGKDPISLTLLNTHTHWDHIQGFPFFAPAYMKGNRLRVIGRNPKPTTLKSIFEKQMDGSHCFPVPLGAMQADISFEHLDPEGQLEFMVGDVSISTCPTNHPGGCLAYRFETPKGRLVFLSDHETAGNDEKRILDFIRDAEILIADTQYTPKEMESRRGWGHGCINGVVSLALQADVKNLFMCHHDPLHDDNFIDQMVQDACQLVPATSPLKIFAAVEGQTISLERE
jgi:phosphoribosyl 1,2-cyclic phosphodiesterase